MLHGGDPGAGPGRGVLSCVSTTRSARAGISAPRSFLRKERPASGGAGASVRSRVAQSAGPPPAAHLLRDRPLIPVGHSRAPPPSTRTRHPLVPRLGGSGSARTRRAGEHTSNPHARREIVTTCQAHRALCPRTTHLRTGRVYFRVQVRPVSGGTVSRPHHDPRQSATSAVRVCNTRRNPDAAGYSIP